jgi:hypothetical protein
MYFGSNENDSNNLGTLSEYLLPHVLLLFPTCVPNSSNRHRVFCNDDVLNEPCYSTIRVINLSVVLGCD